MVGVEIAIVPVPLGRASGLKFSVRVSPADWRLEVYVGDGDWTNVSFHMDGAPLYRGIGWHRRRFNGLRVLKTPPDEYKHAAPLSDVRCGYGDGRSRRMMLLKLRFLEEDDAGGGGEALLELRELAFGEAIDIALYRTERFASMAAGSAIPPDLLPLAMPTMLLSRTSGVCVAWHL
jgi:hypothetical protein